ncbi:MAG: HesA/MoeB/ThiF family protein [Deltaproteobacteria bacterium]|nr:HesA/MoeB/ThiF family protein [Deltaproteobacteria bacterium]
MRAQQAIAGKPTVARAPIATTGSLARERLRAGRVLVVGVGGLGCPATAALARAGVGTVGLMDGDAVELSNLQRQILHGDADLGRPKVESARDKILSINPEVNVRTFKERLTADNLAGRFAEFDFVIDGTDNAGAKFLINDGAVLAGKPYSHAGILGFRGQTMTVLPRRSACYRCLFPSPPPAGEIATCQEAGIVGMVAGALGVIQAAEAIKYLMGSTDLLTDRLLTFDALSSRWRTINLHRSAACPLCGEQPTISLLAEHAGAA